MKKYELTDETIKVYNKTLHRIRYIIDIPTHRIKAGDLGGFLESESNLSHEGSCCVLDKAQVFDSALVSGSAQAYDSARVCGKARMFGSARVCGEARVSEPYKQLIQIQGSIDYITAMLNTSAEDSFVQIGCQKHTLKDWLENFKEIGKKHRYEDEQIKEYGDYLNLLEIRVKGQQ